MFCQKCGKENPDDAQFCGACGATCETVSSDLPPVTKVVTPLTSDETVPDGLKYGVLIGSLFIPLIGFIMGLIYIFGDGNGDKKAVGKLWLIVSIGLGFLFMMISGVGL